MNAAIEIISVKALFTEALRESFDDLDIADKGATGYLADLLARFAATTEMLPEGVTGERLQSIAERMAEIQRSWSIDAEQFDPARELQIRRALADYTLFMSGFFWEAVKERSVTRHYVREGKRAYRFLAEYHRAQGQPDAALYQTLPASRPTPPSSATCGTSTSAPSSRRGRIPCSPGSFSSTRLRIVAPGQSQRPPTPAPVAHALEAKDVSVDAVSSRARETGDAQSGCSLSTRSRQAPSMVSSTVSAA